MEIRIFNFGPIKEFGFDLSKDLTVTYGKNNVGKSYAISVVYLLLKRLLETDYFRLEKLIHSEVSGKESQRLEKQIREEKECNITNRMNHILKNILNNAFAEKLEDSFKNTFGQLSQVKNINAKGTLPLIQINILNCMLRFEVGKKIQVKKFSLDKDVFGKFPAGKSAFLEKKDRYVISLWKEEENFNVILETLIVDIIRRMLYSIDNKFGHLYFFPATRSVIYTSMQSLVPIIAELSQSRAYVTRKIELPGITEPIADYINQLSKIKGIPTGNRGLSSIVSYLEEKILGGEIGFDADKGHLTFSPGKSGLILDMNYVSSMVSELSPFAAFIKYILHENTGNSEGVPKPVIFIEEPEAHLHPEAQVMLAEMFMKLTEAGIKIIVTSHSNYFFNKISNMLIARTLDPNKFAPILLKDTPQGSVSRLMEADHLGIEDENFIDTADALYEERELIIERLNKESDDR
jgi:AAA15 family ATPase/GTPase